MGTVSHFQHLYLLQPGLWEVSGEYFDENENKHVQKGQLIVSHEPDLWTIDGQMEFVSEESQCFSSRYEVDPMPEDKNYTQWKSETGGPEPIYGLFVLVGDTIMAPWQSSSGAYWGQEALIRMSETEYQSRGFAFIKDKKVSSWMTRLSFQG